MMRMIAFRAPSAANAHRGIGSRTRKDRESRSPDVGTSTPNGEHVEPKPSKKRSIIDK